jgi:DivIVA domain-containing protein
VPGLRPANQDRADEQDVHRRGLVLYAFRLAATRPAPPEVRKVDWKDIDRIRVPGFAPARRGYDKHEVDRFLGRLADWLETDAAREIGEAAVARKLERVGKSTANILMTTQQESDELRRGAEEECAQILSDGEATALQARQAADEYAKRTRAQADADAHVTVEAASAEARETIDEGERRRAQIEAVIADLEIRRDDALADLDRLRGELSAMIAGHRRAEPAKGRDGERATKEPAKGRDGERATKEPAKGRDGERAKEPAKA